MSTRTRLRRVGALLLLGALAGACTAVRPVRPTPARLLFGLGTEASEAAHERLVREAPVRMLTSWYNGPDDLGFITGFRDDVVPHAYASGRSLHLIVWTGDAERNIATSYGTACGRSYPLSARFLGDMTKLAKTFAGPASGPKFYVTLFTEFQTYACHDNAWKPNASTTNYYRALKDRYRAATTTFRVNAPNARVSIGWGGWQHRWDDPSTGGGRSMFAYFADVMRASDFQSFQVMNSSTAPADARAMTARLGAYGAVMLAHYDPPDRATFDRDVRALFTDTSIRDLTADGLFAFSFMHPDPLYASESTYQFVKSIVTRYAL